MEQTIDGELYSTETATLVAYNQWGIAFLYKTPEGRFFLYSPTRGADAFLPILDEEAKIAYTELCVRVASRQEAFGCSPN